MATAVAVMLGDGFEPVEAIAPVDILRRGGVEVTTVSVMGRSEVKGAQGITVEADALVEAVDLGSFTMVDVPGGGGGVENLGKCDALSRDLRERMKTDRLVAAICAGPTILAKLGLLEGRKAVCYPGCETDFPAGTYQEGLDVCIDGNLITATGPGTAMAFGLALLHGLEGESTAQAVASAMLLSR